MNTPTSPRDGSHPAPPTEPEQLSLLPDPLTETMVPLQFRLDRRTRELGLSHIAALRQQLLQRRQQPGADGRAA